MIKKLYWIIVSICVSFFTSIVCYGYTNSLWYTFITFIITFGCTLYFDPKTRFGRWAQGLQWATLGFNLFTFVGVFNSKNIRLYVSSGEQSFMNLFAFILILLLYVLDFFNRSDRDKNINWKIGFLNIGNNNIGSGNLILGFNNSISTNNITTEKLTIDGLNGETVISIDGRKIDINDFKFIQELTERRRRLEILANSDRSKDYSSEIIEIQDEIDRKTEILKEHLKGIEKYSTEQQKNTFIEGTKTWAISMNRKMKYAQLDIAAENDKYGFLKSKGVADEYIDSIEYEIEPGHESRDGFIYYHILRFSTDSPENVIKNIPDVEYDSKGYYIRLEPWELEGEDYFEPFDPFE